MSEHPVDPLAPDLSALLRLEAGRPEPSLEAKRRVSARLQATMAVGGGEVGRAAPPPRPLRRPVLVTLASFAAVAAAVALGVSRDPLRSEHLASRGSPGDASPSFDVVCTSGGQVGRCALNGTIAFDVEAPSAWQYLAAFARGEDGTVVWFLPAAGGTSERIPVLERPTLLDHAIRIGDSLPPGKYEVFAIFSDEPLDRAAVKARLGDDLEGRRGISVIRRPLVLDPSP